MRIHELESLVEIHMKGEEHERQLRLRLESERDEWMQRELELARKEITNELTLAHKHEIETMQVRFKFVTQAANNTNMERSSNEQNLEKVILTFSPMSVGFYIFFCVNYCFDLLIFFLTLF